MPFDAAPVETCLTTKPWNVRKLIAWLREGRGPGFDMNSYLMNNEDDEVQDEFAALRAASVGNWCGTHACIAGHAALLAVNDIGILGLINNRYTACYDIAVFYLGINRGQATLLFHAWNDKHSIPEAIAKLEALLVPL